MSKRFCLLLTVSALLMALFVTTSPVLAAFIDFPDYTITCSSASFSYQNTTTDPNTSDGADFAQVTVRNADTNEILYDEWHGPYDDSVVATFPQQPPGSLIEVNVDVSQRIFGSVAVPCVSDTVSIASEPIILAPPCSNLFDGRINRNPALDCAAPVAIYYDPANDRIVVYGINPDSGTGLLAGTIALNDDVSGSSVLATAHPWFSAPLVVTRLSTGEWQLSTTYADGKPYIVVWSTPDDLYHLAA